jgi:hypothetical protein
MHAFGEMPWEPAAGPTESSRSLHMPNFEIASYAELRDRFMPASDRFFGRYAPSDAALSEAKG